MNRIGRQWLARCLAAAALVSGGALADRYWTGATGDNWGTSGNWNGAGGSRIFDGTATGAHANSVMVNNGTSESEGTVEIRRGTAEDPFTMYIDGTFNLTKQFNVGTAAVKAHLDLKGGAGAKLVQSTSNSTDIRFVVANGVARHESVEISASRYVMCTTAGAECEAYMSSGSIVCSQYFVICSPGVDNIGSAYFQLDGGTIACNGTASQGFLIGDNCAPGSSARLVVNGGTVNVNSSTKLELGRAGAAVLDINGGTVNAPGNVIVSRSSSDAAELHYLNLNGGVLATRAFEYGSGSGPGHITFNGGTLQAAAAGTIIPRHDMLLFATGENASTIDTQSYDVSIAGDVAGTGALRKTGGGTLAFTGAQSGTGALVVDEGTLAIQSGATTAARAFSVAAGATLSLPGGASATPATDFAPAAGSTVNFAAITPGTAPIAVSGELALPESGAARLTLAGGSFAPGEYPILSKAGVTAEEGARFEPQIQDGTSARWTVSGDVLTLAVDPIAAELDTANCSIAMDGPTATVAWKLAAANAEPADVKATVADAAGGSQTVTIAQSQQPGAGGTLTLPDVWSAGEVTITLFSEGAGIVTKTFAKSFPATAAASVPGTPAISVDEAGKRISVTCAVATTGSGTTTAWLDYGASATYGTGAPMACADGACAATVPFTDAMAYSGRVFVRVTVSNEVTGVAGTVAFSRSATANAEFTPQTLERSIAIASTDETARRAVVTLGGSAFAEQALIVAWGDKDYGATLVDWPKQQRKPVGAVAPGVTTAAIELPEEVFATGTYYRIFIGDKAVSIYDEEVEWIQPAVLGAYMNTGFKPSKNPKAEFKMNMDGKTYSTEWARVLRAAAGWPNNIMLSVNGSGQINNTRIGNITFKAVSTTAPHVITLSYQYSDRSSNSIRIDGTTASPTGNWNNYNQNYAVTPQTTISLWADADGANPSAVKLYYMKWMNTSGTIEADLIPVKKDGEYCLYDRKRSVFVRNAGADGTSFTGGERTAWGEVWFETAQFAASAISTPPPVMDAANCSIGIDGATASITWKLASAGGETADVIAVLSDANGRAVTNVLAEAQISGASGSATIENVYSDKAVTVSLFAMCGEFPSTAVTAQFPAPGVASVPSLAPLAVDEEAKTITASGAVSPVGSGETALWLEYGHTASYGKRIELTIEDGAYAVTFPYTDALYKAGAVFVRVTASNSVAGVLGTYSWKNSAAASATFTAAGPRTMAMADFDAETGAATLQFGGDAAAEQALVVAWGERDYGGNLASWPYGKRKVLGAVAAAANTETFSLPPEALATGTYYRFFLGDRAVMPYDEEVEWIQPDGDGAWMKTGFTPSGASPRAQMRISLDSKTYGDTVFVMREGTGFYNQIAVKVTNSGNFLNLVHAGNANFGPYSTTDPIDILVVSAKGSKYFTVNGSQKSHNNWNQNAWAGTPSEVTLWADSNGNYRSQARIHYMKWMNSSGALQADLIPVTKDGECCLYDRLNRRLMRNSGEEGTAFKGGPMTAYGEVWFENVQLAATDTMMAGSLDVLEVNERAGTATLAWPALGEAATLWAVYSTSVIDKAPGRYSPAAWDRYVKLADLEAGSEGGTCELPDVHSFTPRCKSHRFVVASADSTAESFKPLLTSEAFRDVKGMHIFLR